MTTDWVPIRRFSPPAPEGGREVVLEAVADLERAVAVRDLGWIIEATAAVRSAVGPAPREGVHPVEEAPGPPTAAAECGTARAGALCATGRRRTDQLRQSPATGMTNE